MSSGDDKGGFALKRTTTRTKRQMFQENLFKTHIEEKNRKGNFANSTFESFVNIPLDFNNTPSRNHSPSRSK